MVSWICWNTIYISIAFLTNRNYISYLGSAWLSFLLFLLHHFRFFSSSMMEFARISSSDHFLHRCTLITRFFSIIQLICLLGFLGYYSFAESLLTIIYCHWAKRVVRHSQNEVSYALRIKKHRCALKPFWKRYFQPAVWFLLQLLICRSCTSFFRSTPHFVNEKNACITCQKKHA